MSPLDDLLARATADPNVVGVVLTGSHARGLATESSDVDVVVIVATPSDTWRRDRTPTLDIAPVTAEQMADTSVLWPRYGFRDARVLLDRGGVAVLVDRQSTPTAEEAREWAREGLDGYVNQLYRAAKSRRDGHPAAAHMDEQESVQWLLMTVFALHGRLRPYNKYLEWELATHPLPDPWNEALAPAYVAHHPVELFPAVADLARTHGHGDIIDDWGADIDLIRRSSAR
ncbi:nucleotidyltransferase domain-containing protein [Actinoplanes sp. TRM 88003]|uniref:Nucleotidyltransferase domain-containing protein n=1 Tax=Paractinoplanes aksuensis TaxID=2939490 RepID=A0ABT1DYB8_9ACTN|nr:nucleotidyltransferase domain-containing protein [Actinoplanes aksuensis]MCO8275885.1 nucleotidyltransferase domain-containing protein [Actinoplanes aksuensis]